MDVFHILATDKMRGAERFALHLVHELSKQGFSQSVGILKSVAAVAPEDADVELFQMASNGAGSLSRLRTLRRIVHEQKPAVVLCHGLGPLKWVRIALLGLRYRPAIIVKKIGMTLPWVRSHASARLAFARWALAAVEKCIVLGPVQAREVIGLLGLPVARVVTISNGRQPPTQQPFSARAPDLIVVVGALEEEKSPEVALEILARLHASGHRVRLKYVGDGSLRAALQITASKLSLSDYVIFEGHLSNIWPSLSAATLLLLCSRTEGVPGVAIEAAFVGLAVVSWDVGDIAAVVENGVTGRITPFGDVGLLAASVKDLLDDPDLCQRYGARARAESGRFSMESVATSYAVLLGSYCQSKEG